MAQGDAAQSRRNQQRRRQLEAPIIRKKRVRYQTSSVLGGLPHMIEGAPQRDLRTKGFSPDAHRGLSPNEIWGRGGLGAFIFNAKERKAWKTEVADFRRKQEMRKNIVSLPDPEDLSAQSRRRREAARRRRRGRLGTILSASPDDRAGGLG